MENGIIESVAVYADSGPKHKTEKAELTKHIWPFIKKKKVQSLKVKIQNKK